MSIPSISPSLGVAADSPPEAPEASRRQQPARTASTNPPSSAARTIGPAVVAQAPQTELMTSVSQVDSDAFEELTFQFDDDVEAELHDDALAQASEDERDIHEPVPVEQVWRVLSLLETGAGYNALKRMAMRIAAAAGQDPARFLDLCLEEMNPQRLDAKQRYAVLNMAYALVQRGVDSTAATMGAPGHDAASAPNVQSASAVAEVAENPPGRVSESVPDSVSESASGDGAQAPAGAGDTGAAMALMRQIGALEDQAGDQLRQMFAHLGAAGSAGSVGERVSTLSQLLATPPTPRTLLQMAPGEGGIGPLGDRLARALDGGCFASDMVNVGVVVGLSRTVALVRTMQDKAGELMGPVPRGGAHDPAELQKQTLALLDIGAAASPGLLVERFVGGLCKGGSRAQRDELHTRMLRQLPDWPPRVWISADTREQVRQTLIKPLLQQAPQRPPTLVGPAASAAAAG